MRTATLLLAALAVAVPAIAQDADPLGRRVGKLESEMKAVQRKVFPGGDPRFFEPEIQPATPAAAEPVGSPATAPLTDLTARVGELEAQLRTLTGQVEANQFKVKQLEDAQAKLRGDVEFRLNALEAGRPAVAAETPAAADPIPPAARPARNPLKPDAATAAPVPTTVEGQWRAAYALVVAKDWNGAETALTDFLAKNPKAVRASDAQYWLGKSYAAEQAHAQAANAFLNGYKNYPKGARASASLLGLAQALLDLKKPDQACRSLNELDAVYGATLTPELKSQAAKARTAAKCKG